MLAFLIVWLDLLQMKEQIIFLFIIGFLSFKQFWNHRHLMSAQKNINLKILSELKVIVPEKRKQDQFASFVKLTDKSKVAVRKY